ncbi:MotE family protein [Methylopila henanensis]|uniref:MotE family protein n=1 Tax=Methylopila henanensis TaxID=873516 RepID=A0ABW4K6G0_9HYPH
MTSRLRLHLMPVVIIAAAALLSLKAMGLMTHSSYLFAGPAAASPAAAPEPAAHGGEAPAADPAPMAAKAPAAPPPPDVSPSERALLEALQKRRAALEERSDDLDLRENLLKAAEKRMDERLIELRRLEEQVAASDARRAEEEKTKLKNLITMYEGMKVKEAARIFDDLEPGVRFEVARRMNPRKLSEILGKMSPEAAQKLTVALARGDGDKTETPAPVAVSELPKIEGR